MFKSSVYLLIFFAFLLQPANFEASSHLSFLRLLHHNVEQNYTESCKSSDSLQKLQSVELNEPLSLDDRHLTVNIISPCKVCENSETEDTKYMGLVLLKIYLRKKNKVGVCSA